MERFGVALLAVAVVLLGILVFGPRRGTNGHLAREAPTTNAANLGVLIGVTTPATTVPATTIVALTTTLAPTTTVAPTTVRATPTTAEDLSKYNEANFLAGMAVIMGWTPTVAANPMIQSAGLELGGKACELIGAADGNKATTHRSNASRGNSESGTGDGVNKLAANTLCQTWKAAAATW